jgi:hypothetical protein
MQRFPLVQRDGMSYKSGLNRAVDHSSFGIHLTGGKNQSK